MSASSQSNPVHPDAARDAADISTAVVESAAPQHIWSFKPPPFETVQCIPKKERSQIFGFAVLEASAVAHEPLANGGNHWTFYLTATPNPLDLSERRLIQLDSTPSGTTAGSGSSGSKANIVISLLEDRDFSRAHCICRQHTRDSLTVGDFVNAVTEYGRDKYDFDERGRGCKRWTADQMDLFLNLGLFVEEDDVRDAKNHMMFQWDGFQRIGDHSEWAVGPYYE
ncbi:hypothetical protein LZ30DRAFT_468431 [Colletotrichum cereale]|nr:hypothetical protein LZ30DRAFT_468431 [Colletotrichum cereale]